MSTEISTGTPMLVNNPATKAAKSAPVHAGEAAAAIAADAAVDSCVDDPGSPADTVHLLRSVLDTLTRLTAPLARSRGLRGQQGQQRLNRRDLAAMCALVDRLTNILREHDRGCGRGDPRRKADGGPRRVDAASPSSVVPPRRQQQRHRAAEPEAAVQKRPRSDRATTVPACVGSDTADAQSGRGHGGGAAREDSAPEKRVRKSRWSPAAKAASLARVGTEAPSLLSAVEEEVVRRSGWPRDLFADRARQPRVLHSVEQFMRELQFGCHMDEVVVLRNGVHRMGFEKALPGVVADNVGECSNVKELLQKMHARDASLLDRLQGRIYYYADGKEQELKHAWRKGHKPPTPTGGGASSTGSAGSDASGSGDDDNDEPPVLSTLGQKLSALETRDDLPSDVYLAEMRWSQKFRHPLDGQWTKSFLSADVKDVCGPDGVRMMPYWDRWDEGVFIGSNTMGSCLHVDQCLWSNVGKNFAGYKVMAMWPFGHPSNEVCDDHWGQLFRPRRAGTVTSTSKSNQSGGGAAAAMAGTTRTQARALASCCQMAVLHPGDVFFFSGACAHMAMCVGLPGAELSVTAYESFVNIHPRHCEVLCKTNKALHFFECHMRWSELNDLKWEVADVVNDLLRENTYARLSPENRRRVVAAVRAFRADTFMRSILDVDPAVDPPAARCDEDKEEDGGGAGGGKGTKQFSPSFTLDYVAATAAAAATTPMSPPAAAVATAAL